MFHSAACSHQDQWWLSCACALHFLAMRDGSLGCPLLNTSMVLVLYPSSYTYPFSLFPPLQATSSRVYTQWHSAQSLKPFPVASRYRYIPNTIGRKRFCWLPFSSACVCTYLTTFWFQFVICFALLALSIRFIRFVNSHPICTCSC